MENTDPPHRAIMHSPTSVSNALTNTSDIPPINLSPIGNVIITINVSNEDDPSSPSDSDPPHPQPPIRLLVNDTIIRSASQKFSTMLFPPEPEHQQQRRLLSHPSDVWPQPPIPPKEVVLPIPDDNMNPDALRTILCVLHHRNDLVDQVPKPRELLHIAILADKYDLHRALKLASDARLEKSLVDCAAMGPQVVDLGIDPDSHYDPVFRHRMTPKEIMHLVAAAWLFRNKSAFAKLTVELAMRHQESFTRFLEDRVLEQAMPKKFWILLIERTARLRSNLLELIYILGQEDEADGKPTPVCTHPWHSFDDYQQLYKRFGSGRVRPSGNGYPPIDLVFGIETVNKHERMCPGCVCGNRELDPQAVQEKLERIKEGVRICVECVEKPVEMVCSHLD